MLRPGGHLYVPEPAYAGPLNELIRLFNDEGIVRAAAQSALDEALIDGARKQVGEWRFDMPVRFLDFDDFEQRMMRPTFADHAIDAAELAAVQAAFESHRGSDEAQFRRPMHVLLLLQCP